LHNTIYNSDQLPHINDKIKEGYSLWVLVND